MRDLSESPVGTSEVGRSHSSHVLPAGCGKTQTIARVAVECTDRGQSVLILTHTHAAISVIRNRLSRMGANWRRTHIYTIDGFALSLVRRRSRLGGITDVDLDDWVTHTGRVVDGAAKLLQYAEPRELIANSYDCLLVDEYQDCSVQQHKFIIGLSAILSTRVYGDPFQSVFEWDPSRIMDWKKSVATVFPDEPHNPTPYRWSANPDLGRALLAIRPEMERNSVLNLSGSPITIQPMQVPAEIGEYVMERFEDSSTVVVLVLGGPWLAIEMAIGLGSPFQVVDAIYSKQILEVARAIDSCNARRIAKAISKLALDSYRTVTKATVRSLEESLRDIVGSGGCAESLQAICELQSTHGESQFRREAWYHLMEAIKAHIDAPETSVLQRVMDVRARISVHGRMSESRLVSTTVLAKGLEFDHVIVTSPQDSLWPRNHLYVALTRGSKSVTVCSITDDLALSS